MKENTKESIRKIEELEWTRKLGKRNLEGVGNVTRQGQRPGEFAHVCTHVRTFMSDVRTCMYV